MESGQQDSIDLILSVQKGSISLSVFDSDSITNAAVMEQVVGTLVKYSGVGRYEAFLAKSWHASEDQKTWTFEFYPHLKSEDGVEINAESFTANFKKLLRIYAQQYSPPTFNRLQGWKEFTEGKEEALGVKALSQTTLVMTFDSVPSGLLEFLSMPYFGFYSPFDFDGDKWRDNNVIHSTGSYKVDYFSEDEIILKARYDWPLMNKKSPGTANVRHISLEETLKEKKNFIIQLTDSNQVAPQHLVKFNSTPTMLTAVVLSPLVAPFNSLKVRQAMRTVLREKIKKRKLENNLSRKTNHFYDGFNKLPLFIEDYESALSLLKEIKVSTIPVFQQKLNESTNTNFVMEVLKETIHEIGWKIDVDTPATLGKDWIKKGLDNSRYALRTAGVDIGGSPENWVIDMMFCSRLGISFPDIDDKICHVVRNYELGMYPEKEQYWMAIHNAIEEGASVVPVIHSGLGWFLSPTIDMQNVSSSMNVPRFDQLSIKK